MVCNDSEYSLVVEVGVCPRHDYSIQNWNAIQVETAHSSVNKHAQMRGAAQQQQQKPGNQAQQ